LERKVNIKSGVCRFSDLWPALESEQSLVRRVGVGNLMPAKSTGPQPLYKL